MTAPPLKTLRLDVHRVRCTCQAETLVVFPAPWYRHQATHPVEEACHACGKSLLPMQVPDGAVHRVYALADVPLGVAAAVSPELAAEVADAQETPAAEISLDPADWSQPHEPSAAYADWVAAQPAPAPIDRAVWVRNGAATAVLAAIVLLALLF